MEKRKYKDKKQKEDKEEFNVPQMNMFSIFL